MKLIKYNIMDAFFTGVSLILFMKYATLNRGQNYLKETRVNYSDSKKIK